MGIPTPSCSSPRRSPTTNGPSCASTALAQKAVGADPVPARGLEIPFSHHERWDGTGYPQGLAGEKIPLAARVFAVVDIWDALLRPTYRPAWPVSQVIEYLREQSGKRAGPARCDRVFANAPFDVGAATRLHLPHRRQHVVATPARMKT